MKSLILRTIAGVLLATACFAVEPAHTVHGRIYRIGSDVRKMVIKTADGMEYAFRWTGETTVHGAKAGSVDLYRGLKEGGEVVVHYSEKGGEKVAIEVDRLGGDGLTAVEGTVTGIDRGARVVAVKTAGGAEETFHVSERGMVEVAKGVKEGTRVTAYYLADGGRKVGHYFEAHN